MSFPEQKDLIQIERQTNDNVNLSNPEICFKIVILGDSGVGKTCIMKRFIHNKFLSNNYSTIGFEFYNVNIKINNLNIRLQIWDTCGQEAYKSLITNFYKNSSLAVLVFSIDE